MVVRMVLHIIKFVNGFPRRGGIKHYSPGKIMTNRRIHANDIVVSFGVYCQIAENVEPRNSLAPRTRGAILLGNSGFVWWPDVPCFGHWSHCDQTSMGGITDAIFCH